MFNFGKALEKHTHKLKEIDDGIKDTFVVRLHISLAVIRG